MGGKRSHRSVRCIGCRMILQLCICGFIPQIEARARFLFVVHPSERWKTTNTGRIAVQGLRDADMVYWTGRVSPFEPAVSVAADASAVLFPPSDGRPALAPAVWAAEVESRGLRPTVVVPDGTWPQCRKMVGKHDALRELPRLALPGHAAGRGGLRLECLSYGMSTIDAVAWMLEALDGPAAAAPMAALHRAMLERTMASRGKPLPDGPTLKELLAP